MKKIVCLFLASIIIAEIGKRNKNHKIQLEENLGVICSDGTSDYLRGKLDVDQTPVFSCLYAFDIHRLS